MSYHIDSPAIPQTVNPSWEAVYSIEIKENNEKLVPLSLTENHFLVRPAYFYAGITKALPECYARNEIRKMLLKANGFLPKGLRLIILDSWRSKETQTALFNECVAALIKVHPDKDEKTINKMASEFVATPSLDPAHPSPHATGGAVDLTIATTEGEPLFFGAAFDYPGAVSNTRYFEERLERGETLTDIELESMKNRRLLYDVMTRAGFVNYHGEWWHFEYGTQRWAYTNKEDHALYGPKIITLNSFAAFVPSFNAGITTLVSAGG